MVLSVLTLNKAAHLPGSISKYLQLSLRDQWLFAVTYVLLGLIRFSLLYFPFKMIAPRLGAQAKSAQPTSFPGTDSQELFCSLVRVIEQAGRHTPWQSRCLVQSVCLALFLIMYRIPYALCIGMMPLTGPDKQKSMAAHAWVVAGEQIASWGSDHTEYIPVCRFVSRRIAINTAPQFPTYL